jgi:hypothetical protein
MSGTPPTARAPGSSRKIVLPSFTVSVTLMSAMVVGSTAVGSFDRMAKSASSELLAVLNPARQTTHWPSSALSFPELNGGIGPRQI